MLTFAGVALCLVALALTALAARSFGGLLPLDLLDAEGGPGTAVVGVVPAPGSVPVELEGGADYDLFVAHDHGGADLAVELEGDITVRAPDGTAVDVRDHAEVDQHLGRGDTQVDTVGSFRAARSGTYTVKAPSTADGSTASVLIAPEQHLMPFVGGIFGTVLGLLGAVFVGIVGACMTIGGALWWRSRARTQAAQGAPRAAP